MAFSMEVVQQGGDKCPLGKVTTQCCSGTEAEQCCRYLVAAGALLTYSHLFALVALLGNVANMIMKS
eukprot:2424298-Pleurochrysis_carterae.AAC.1